MEGVRAVVSPGGKIHAIRAAADATACGLNHHKKRKRTAGVFLGWVPLASDFDTFVQRGQFLCLNCVENLERGTGPGLTSDVAAGLSKPQA